MTPKKILVPIDFSPCAEYALDYACELAPRIGAEVVLVNALGATVPEMAVSETALATMFRGHRAALDALVASHGDGVAFDMPVVKNGDARDAIVDTASELGADLVIMGTHGHRGFSRLMLGSVAEEVLRRAPCPVLTVRKPKEA